MKKEKVSPIVEKIQDICPLIVDFDFKYKEKLIIRQYNDKILKKFVEIMFQHLTIFYNLSDEQCVCWIMEKNPLDAPQRGYESKMGYVCH